MKSVGLDNSRLLLVGEDAAWIAVARQSAARLGLALDEVSEVSSALARMLRPDHVYRCVLAISPLSSRSLDALAGMLDEVTLYPTPMLLLGCASHPGANAVSCVAAPHTETLIDAIQALAPAAPEQRSSLNPDELVAALHGGGLRMRFQPIVRQSDLRPIGVEALARIHTRQRGILHPKDFIPATFASGRERVLTAIAASRTFLEVGKSLCHSDLFVSINLPLVSVLHTSSLTRGRDLCAVAGVSPSRIVIEVLESRTAPDLEQLRTALECWRGAGFRMAIDDAGPALPHWRDLLDLPFDVVKLDGALVADPAGAELLQTIVTEARARGRFVVAEGIENEACLARVRPLGVDALQGFMFARPLPAMALPLWLDHWHQQTGLQREEMAA